MSKTKEKYYKFKEEGDTNFGGVCFEISDYVTELEKEKETLLKYIRTIKDISKKDGVIEEMCDNIIKEFE